ncbi:PAS domain S-box protein [Thiocapsa sp.]|uniref:PAS domain S-box protein n=1 Tax=Thiocapsa sp. TaxID=2024551 RepID=UPI0035936CB2
MPADTEVTSLRETVRRFRNIFDSANDAILVVDPDTDRIIEANAQAARMLGYDSAELTGAVRVSTIHPHEMETFRAFAREVRACGTGWTNELSCLRKDGRSLPSEISASVVPFDGQHYIVAMVRDVSARKAAEQSLRQSEQRFRAFVENAGDGFFLVDASGQIRDANSRAAEMLGYRPGELIGRSVLAIDTELTAESFAALVQELEIDRPRLLESRHRRRDGSVFPSEVSVCAYGSPEQPNYIALLRDVSRRKEADAAIERLAEMGEFAAMIIHQIRNPLASINLCLDFFASRTLDARAERRLTLAQGEAERLTRLLDELLHYAGRRPLSLADVEVDALIRELVPALRSMPLVAERDLEVSLGLPNDRSRADADQLRQVLTNLIVNACEAVAPGERIEVCTARAATSATPLIEVRNGGEAIPQDVLARIGKPFFSTKASGNGLGIAYVRRIAEAHHWRFTLSSNPDEGTVARLTL